MTREEVIRKLTELETEARLRKEREASSARWIIGLAIPLVLLVIEKLVEWLPKLVK